MRGVRRRATEGRGWTPGPSPAATSGSSAVTGRRTPARRRARAEEGQGGGGKTGGPAVRRGCHPLPGARPRTSAATSREVRSKDRSGWTEHETPREKPTPPGTWRGSGTLSPPRCLLDPPSPWGWAGCVHWGDPTCTRVSADFCSSPTAHPGWRMTWPGRAGDEGMAEGSAGVLAWDMGGWDTSGNRLEIVGHHGCCPGHSAKFSSSWTPSQQGSELQVGVRPPPRGYHPFLH